VESALAKAKASVRLDGDGDGHPRHSPVLPKQRSILSSPEAIGHHIERRRDSQGVLQLIPSPSA
jgi:hypothetical protein